MVIILHFDDHRRSSLKFGNTRDSGSLPIRFWKYRLKIPYIAYPKSSEAIEMFLVLSQNRHSYQRKLARLYYNAVTPQPVSYLGEDDLAVQCQRAACTHGDHGADAELQRRIP